MYLKTLYLANPYGFSESQRQTILPQLVDILEEMGFTVWEPFTKNQDLTQYNDPYRVGQADMNDVYNADGIFAVVNGTPPDEGVMVELGMAIAKGKRIFLFRDDFRRCTDTDTYPLNLMLFVGFAKDTWRDHYYTSIDEIKSPRKALYQWVHSQQI
ncbi:MAG: nucleoside 2-deoxyribosyltransferase [Cenarchaeum sp. SB0669_bin_11]|nr:nucleoside 2-deoxyribosyltransferase [Cenarchaeum sp. SB0675_bin_21]MYL12004.1 nucleoside 2-deoxyribosyltransferase [Cenarchaeum sp. SB0669_bin_11]